MKVFKLVFKFSPSDWLCLVWRMQLLPCQFLCGFHISSCVIVIELELAPPCVLLVLNLGAFRIVSLDLGRFLFWCVFFVCFYVIYFICFLEQCVILESNRFIFCIFSLWPCLNGLFFALKSQLQGHPNWLLSLSCLLYVLHLSIIILIVIKQKPN